MTDAFVIEKNVPIFDPATRNAGPFLLALRELEVGDSFAFEKKPQSGSAIISETKRSGRKFKTAKGPDGKHRVWRIA